MTDELYMSYAAGSLSPGLSLLMREHVAMNATARSHVRAWEHIGGALLEQATPSAWVCPPSVWARLDDDAVIAEEDSDGAPGAALETTLGAPVADLTWRQVLPGMAEHRIEALCTSHETVKLVRFQAGRKMLPHTHDGVEVTLVLEGGYRDETGAYAAGDVAMLGADVEHQPAVDPDRDCLCLTVMEGRIHVPRPIIAFTRYFLQ